MDKKTQPKYSLLSVDDDADVRKILNEVISHLGHKSVTAVDGMDALEKFSETHFDIMITDINMPRMDGIELMKHIKAEFDDVDQRLIESLALAGFMAGYIRWSGMVPITFEAIMVMERILGRQMGPAGRNIVTAAADALAAGSGSAEASSTDIGDDPAAAEAGAGA